jgi:hypothetical protein
LIIQFFMHLWKQKSINYPPLTKIICLQTDKNGPKHVIESHQSLGRKTSIAYLLGQGCRWIFISRLNYFICHLEESKIHLNKWFSQSDIWRPNITFILSQYFRERFHSAHELATRSCYALAQMMITNLFSEPCNLW